MTGISKAQPGDHIHSAGSRWLVTEVTQRSVIGRMVDSNGADLNQSCKWARTSGISYGRTAGRAVLETPSLLEYLRQQEKRLAERAKLDRLDLKLSDCICRARLLRGREAQIDALASFLANLTERPWSAPACSSEIEPSARPKARRPEGQKARKTQFDDRHPDR